MSQPDAAPQRGPTEIDALADAYLDKAALLSPVAATAMGITDYDGLLDDFSPDGAAARAGAQREALAKLRSVEPVDATDRVTAAALRERLGNELDLYEAGEYRRDLNNIASPVQHCRDCFDLMKTETVEDWAVISARLGEVPKALASYQRSLAEGVARGQVPAARQVRIGIGQAETLAQPGSFWDTLAPQASASAPPALLADLRQRGEAARAAYGELAQFLGRHIAPEAPEVDGVGRERYQLASRYFLGEVVDLEETYAWGEEQLAGIIKEQRAVAAELYGPGTPVAEAYQRLDADPAYQIEGTAGLKDWMNQTAGQVIAGVDGVEFDLPGPVRALEGRIAPTQLGGIYYVGPSEDFTRPGTMWWSVPPGTTTFHTWRERTTVHHEGVPGHHMQIAYATYLAGSLNRWRRLGVWVSGHGEGWALYAEKLMDELGYLPTPADRLGMLDGQRLRAARVVLDIGVHLGLEYPAHLGGGRWDGDKAWDFLSSNVAMEPASARFELDRYLGWPGQAPSYLLGQHLWERLRSDAEASARRRGASFSRKDFHMGALALGSLGLGTLRDVMAGVFDANA